MKSFQLQMLKIDYGCIVMILLLSWASGQNNFHPVKSCTDIRLRDIPEDVFQKCTEADKVIHCVPNEKDELGLSCFPVTWIGPVRCPYYNSYQGNMDEKVCNETIGWCAKDHYKSPSSLLYNGCYARENVPTTTKAATTTVMELTTRESPPHTYTTSVSFEKRIIGPSSNICEDCQCVVEKVLFSIFLVFIVILGVGIILEWKWKVISTQCNRDSQNQQTQNEPEELSLTNGAKAKQTN